MDRRNAARRWLGSGFTRRAITGLDHTARAAFLERPFELRTVQTPRPQLADQGRGAHAAPRRPGCQAVWARLSGGRLAMDSWHTFVARAHGDGDSRAVPRRTTVSSAS